MIADGSRGVTGRDPIAKATAAGVAAAPLGLPGEFTDPDPCEFRPDGYCHAHGWWRTTPRCPHGRTVDAVEGLWPGRVVFVPGKDGMWVVDRRWMVAVLGGRWVAVDLQAGGAVERHLVGAPANTLVGKVGELIGSGGGR